MEEYSQGLEVVALKVACWSHWCSGPIMEADGPTDCPLCGGPMYVMPEYLFLLLKEEGCIRLVDPEEKEEGPNE